MKILITGGAGFIGSHVVDGYLSAGHQVGVVDDFSTGKRANLGEENRENLSVYEADIRDAASMAKIVGEFQPDVVSHHAAQISVVASAEQPLADLHLNVVGTVNLLEAVRTQAPKAKFVYATSGGAMYGAGSDLPYTEDTFADPDSPYGLSKYVAERYVWLYTKLYGLQATVLRYSNVYGPRQDAHGEAGVCAIFAERLMTGEPLTIYGDGSSTRDYVYVGDVVAANLAALEGGAGQAFNISTGQEVATSRVLALLQQATGSSQAAHNAPLRPGELARVVLSPKKAAEELGWKSEVPFEQGIVKTVEWYKLAKNN